jgi:hypothetical protein
LKIDEIEQLKQDILDVLPDEHGYILIALPIGIPAAPTYLSNMERIDAVHVMSKILEVFNQTAVEGNGA